MCVSVCVSVCVSATYAHFVPGTLSILLLRGGSLDLTPAWLAQRRARLHAAAGAALPGLARHAHASARPFSPRQPRPSQRSRWGCCAARARAPRSRLSEALAEALCAAVTCAALEERRSGADRGTDRGAAPFCAPSPRRASLSRPNAAPRARAARRECRRPRARAASVPARRAILRVRAKP